MSRPSDHPVSLEHRALSRSSNPVSPLQDTASTLSADSTLLKHFSCLPGICPFYGPGPALDQPRRTAPTSTLWTPTWGVHASTWDTTLTHFISFLILLFTKKQKNVSSPAHITCPISTLVSHTHGHIQHL